MAIPRSYPPVIALVGVGLVGGLLAGFFGVGGGVAMVPLLLWWARMTQRRAQATSLLAIAPAAIVGIASYGSWGVFPLWPAIAVASGSAIGAQFGTLLLRRLDIERLRWGFILFVATAAIFTLISVPNRNVQIEVDLGAVVILGMTGLLMGLTAGLFGVGGGVIAIPLLMLTFGIGDLEAKAISLLAMVPGAISGGFSHLKHRTAALRDGAWIGLGAVVAAPLGTLWAFSLPAPYANITFGLFALSVASALAIRAWRN